MRAYQRRCGCSKESKMTMSDKEFNKCNKACKKLRLRKYYLKDFENIIESAFRCGYEFAKGDKK